jgi:5-methylcytosine-specific restriction protein A
MVINDIRKRKSQGNTYTDTSFYRSKPWRSLRAQKLKNDPKCVKCGQPGTMVDHIQRIEAGGLKLDISNLQTMCDHCHNVKRAQEKNEKYKRI